MSEDFNDCTPILAVRDVEKSVAYYRDALGFTVDFQFGEPATYAGIYRGLRDFNVWDLDQNRLVAASPTESS